MVNIPERIVISSDHAGYDLKCYLAPFIASLGYEVEDVGAFSKESVDYPDYTLKAALKVASGECFRGIVFCGTGQGDAMVANKVPGIRARAVLERIHRQDEPRPQRRQHTGDGGLGYRQQDRRGDDTPVALHAIRRRQAPAAPG